MVRGDGNWLIVMKLPNMESKPVGRYISRSEAEHTKERLIRLTGNRAPYIVVFDPPEQRTLPAYLTR